VRRCTNSNCLMRGEWVDTNLPRCIVCSALFPQQPRDAGPPKVPYGAPTPPGMQARVKRQPKRFPVGEYAPYRGPSDSTVAKTLLVIGGLVVAVMLWPIALLALMCLGGGGGGGSFTSAGSTGARFAAGAGSGSSGWGDYGHPGMMASNAAHLIANANRQPTQVSSSWYQGGGGCSSYGGGSGFNSYSNPTNGGVRHSYHGGYQGTYSSNGTYTYDPNGVSHLG
jgi:hypothetical protein